MSIAELNRLICQLKKFNDRKHIYGRKGKAVIDIETLQIWPSLTDCAQDIQTSAPFVYQAIIQKYKCKGRLLEYFDDWIAWPNKDKEHYSRKNNIYFY